MSACDGPPPVPCPVPGRCGLPTGSSRKVGQRAAQVQGQQHQVTKQAARQPSWVLGLPVSPAPEPVRLWAPQELGQASQLPVGISHQAHGGATVSSVKCPQQGQSHMAGGGAEPVLGSWWGSAETQLASQSQLKGPLLWEGGLLPEKSHGM